MKRMFIISFLFLFYTLTFSQAKVDPGIPSYVNVNIIPLMEYSKDASNPAILGGLAVTISFNNKIFIGGFLEHKINNTKSDLAQYPEFNSRFQQIGFWGGGKLSLGAYKSSAGQYLKRKTKFVYSMQIGEGRLKMIGATDSEESSYDYFLLIKPLVGLERPIFKNTALFVNAGYLIPFRIEKFYENSDYAGITASIGLKFSLFSKKIGSLYIP